MEKQFFVMIQFKFLVMQRKEFIIRMKEKSYKNKLYTISFQLFNHYPQD